VSKALVQAGRQAGSQAGLGSLLIVDLLTIKNDQRTCLHACMQCSHHHMPALLPSTCLPVACLRWPSPVPVQVDQQLMSQGALPAYL
jgi:hypothetical protein